MNGRAPWVIGGSGPGDPGRVEPWWHERAANGNGNGHGAANGYERAVKEALAREAAGKRR